MSTETEYMNTSAAEENRKEIRNCFPILQTTVHERPLVYLDNAATMQMPLPVIERMTAFYTRKNANIHRGIHTLSEMSTEAYEKELRGIPGMRILGDIPEGKRAGCLSFVAEGVHAYDLCRFLDQYGIAARSGHHCAMPYLTAMGCEYAVRFSAAPYNTEKEIRYAADACRKICELIRKTSGSCRRQ